MEAHTDSELEYLLSTRAVRERCGRLHDLALNGKTHFQIHPERLNSAADYVLKVIHSNYPNLDIPFHSRWGHFRAGGTDRVAPLRRALEGRSMEERLLALYDLCIVSVLLDAGAGPIWKYRESSTGLEIGRSEGLALASLQMFLDGSFSSDPSDPLRADADRLALLTEKDLRDGFQISESANPLVGVAGRAELLRALGRASQGFEVPRPGALALDCLQWVSRSGALPAHSVLGAVLRRLGPIWPGRVDFHGTNLGDTWTHSLLGPNGQFESLVPFHKLSQWLSYSLMEPLIWEGISIVSLEEMTGLPEYRNGGLFLDLGVLELRNPSLAGSGHSVDSELVIEWRALTVVLLDQIADRIQKLLKKSSGELPLVKVLEGGTWWAGRRIANEKRPGGAPPLQVISDGTVF